MCSSGRLTRRAWPAGCKLSITGVSRATVATSFLYSVEVDRNFIVSCYQYFLGRQANPAEDQFWVDGMQTGRISIDSFADCILASPEYFAQFSSP
jgi:hypothetical protein